MKTRLTLLLIVGLLLPTGAVASANRTAERPAAQLPQRYYLALGDSIAYGIQPTKASAVDRPAAFPGYVAPFAAQLRKLSPKLQVVNYGCPGESTTTFAHGRCPSLADGVRLHDAFRGSQLAAARAFLRAHPGEVSPITLTLWGNDVVPLSARGKRASSEIASFASRFDSILKQLRASAPNAMIIVTGAWNPEADKLAQTDPLYRKVDAAIARSAASSRARVANMYAALNGSGSFKTQQARLCRLTFMCSQGDPHPTNAGYRAMTDAFLKAAAYPAR